jgi:DNA mismatch endonuclease, patch repair protein
MQGRRGKAPTFVHFEPSSDAASTIKKKTPRTNTTPELALRRTLWSVGLRYQLHRRDLPGRPDLVFPSAKVVVFCDGDFWHGRNWEERQRRLQSGGNASYWISKIQYNMERDQDINTDLTSLGWTVLRFWESEIKADVHACARAVTAAVRSTACSSNRDR